MAIAPVHNLPKKEILQLAARRCRHSHSYLSHYNCYLKELHDKQERIGFLDIEASNLDANFGFMISYCIKDSLSDIIYEDIITPKDIEHLAEKNSKEEDYRVVKNCIKDMLRFDKVVGFYSTKFDLPYIRTRALVNGLEFPNFGSLVHKDVYYIVRNKFKLNNNKQVTACRVLLGDTDKTIVDGKIWRQASRGSKKDLQYIIEHNRADVCDLEKLYNKIICFVGRSQTSI